MTPAIALPTPSLLGSFRPEADSFARQSEEIARAVREADDALGALEARYGELCDIADATDQYDEVDALMLALWELACDWARAYQRLLVSARELPRGPFRSTYTRALSEQTERLVDLMRTMVVVWDELELETPEDIFETVWTFTVPPLAYLRAMWNLFWSCIRHPLSETTIELKTGRVLYHE